MSPKARGRGLKMPVCVRETEKKKKKKTEKEREGGRRESVGLGRVGYDHSHCPRRAERECAFVCVGCPPSPKVDV